MYRLYDEFGDFMRVVKRKEEAEHFRKELKQLHLENADYENETTFWVQPLDFGRFGR